MRTRTTIALLIALFVPVASFAGSKDPGPKVMPSTPRQFISSGGLPGIGAAEVTLVASAAEETRATGAIAQALAQASSTSSALVAEVATINGQPRKTPVAASDRLIAVLKRCNDFSALTKGAFDITGASAAGGFHFMKRDWRRLKVDTANKTVTIKSDEVEIDPAAFALALRGFLADDIIAALSSGGWSNVQVKISNVTRNIGRDIHTPWTVQLDCPTSAEEGKFAYRATNLSISNAGTAMINPRLFPNGIIDPRTRELIAKPAVVNAIVFASDAATASAYAVATYANSATSADGGLRFIESHPEIKGIVVALDGTVLSSNGLGLGKSPRQNATAEPAP